MPAVVLGVDGAQGYYIPTGDSSYAEPSIAYSYGNTTIDKAPNLAGISACASDTFDADSLTFDLTASQNVNCWPWTNQVLAMVRTKYTTTATDTSSCKRGIDALGFLQWLYANTLINTLTDTEDIQFAPGVSPAVQAAYIAALDSVTCDGETLLITLPTDWSLTSAIGAFVDAMSVLGLLGCAVAAVLVWYHRAHPVIRSASPLFLLMSIGGVALLFVAGFLLVAPVTSASCSAFSWSLNFGLMLCFAPLFAKTYRIYRIFGRKKLSVVQLSNRKLFLYVVCMLSIEAVLLAVWQGVGPIAPLVSDVTTTQSNSAGNLIINQYTQCGVPEGVSMTLFALVLVEKGVLFVFGALMAFTTRKVSSTFNESQGISLSIYNVCFTIGIISPIIIVVSAMGDVLTLLLAFALLWIAYFTGSILFIPKLMTIYMRTNGKDDVNNSVIGSSSSSSGFQFVSLAAFSTLPLLLSYLAALKKHVEQVEIRVTKLRTNKAGGLQSSFASPTGAHRAPISQRQTSAVSAIISPNALSAASRSHSCHNEESVLHPAGVIASDEVVSSHKRSQLAASGGSWAQHTTTGLRPRAASASVTEKEERTTTAEGIESADG